MTDIWPSISAQSPALQILGRVAIISNHRQPDLIPTASDWRTKCHDLCFPYLLGGILRNIVVIRKEIRWNSGDNFEHGLQQNFKALWFGIWGKTCRCWSDIGQIIETSLVGNMNHEMHRLLMCWLIELHREWNQQSSLSDMTYSDIPVPSPPMTEFWPPHSTRPPALQILRSFWIIKIY